MCFKSLEFGSKLVLDPTLITGGFGPSLFWNVEDLVPKFSISKNKEWNHYEGLKLDHHGLKYILPHIFVSVTCLSLQYIQCIK